MKTAILELLVTAVLCYSKVIAGDGIEDRAKFFDSSYKSLEKKVTPYPGLREHGIMIKCNGEMIPAARLNAWARALTPRSESEWNHAWKEVNNNNGSIRYIAVRSIAYGLNMKRSDLGEKHSFFDALQEPGSKSFRSLIELLKKKSE
jgi:hypothetical protein